MLVRTGLSIVLLVATPLLSSGQQRDSTLAAPRSPTYATSLAAITGDWERCLKGNKLASDRYTIDCNERTEDLLDTLVTTVIADHLKSLSKFQRRQFEFKQRLWYRRSSKACESDPWYRFDGGGTKYPGTAALVDYGFCMISALQKRIPELIE